MQNLQKENSKVAFELASYAKKKYESLGTTVTAVTVNADDVSELSKYE
jgi:electron transfer flavoprotein alpha subunit